MTLDKARRNWKVTAAVSTAAVIVLILLWPKIRDALGGLTFGDVVLNVPAPGAVDYPDIFLEINYPPTVTVVNDGGTCGCEGHGQEAIDAAMDYFLNGMRQLNDTYNAQILASRPDWAIQYWNNARGYALSQSSGAFFGGR